MTSTKDLILADLPCDVIRTIISVGLERVHNMNLISPRWCSVARDHLIVRANLPVITAVRWHHFHSLVLEMSMTIPGKYRAFFGVKNWLQTARLPYDSEKVELSPPPGKLLGITVPPTNALQTALRKRIMRCARKT
ncbi:hypothetical protein PRIPAC_92081 [Pristionchus pacificus]|uniref:Uncharacterized protein n=1 Tax=Pristionchus pacificus TaxID=54126 RepID=A0A2A6CCX2_PRIPA|nr:hypothetical protein PRIPAC_92081 [Pristionchus pacificus]|eukprot:PDM76044.1 hypothetical protein PRIPAC_39648 [Pristionchus pacificus]